MTTSLWLILLGGGLLLLTEGLQTVAETGTLPWQVTAPQLWLTGIAFAIAWVIKKQRPSNHAVVFALAFPLAVAMVSFWAAFATDAPVETWQEAVNNWYREVNLVRAGDLGLMFMYASLTATIAIFWPLAKWDLTGRCLCGILWVGELYMLAEHFICNFIWPVEGAAVVASKIAGTDQIYACSRVDLSELIWAPASGQTLIILIMAWYLIRARAKTEPR